LVARISLGIVSPDQHASSGEGEGGKKGETDGEKKKGREGVGKGAQGVERPARSDTIIPSQTFPFSLLPACGHAKGGGGKKKGGRKREKGKGKIVKRHSSFWRTNTFAKTFDQAPTFALPFTREEKKKKKGGRGKKKGKRGGKGGGEPCT